MDTLSFLLAPFIASLILTGIHAYLGVHVVERGVVFVDLSLAQIAALGSTVAVPSRTRNLNSIRSADTLRRIETAASSRSCK